MGGAGWGHVVQPMAWVWAPSRSEVPSGPRLSPGAEDRVGGGPGPAALFQRQLTKNKLRCQGLLAPGSGEEGRVSGGKGEETQPQLRAAS